MCNGPICRAIAATTLELAISTPLPPANDAKPKVLTLKFVPFDSPLLRLPREIRDIVYWYALVEPRKWDKRHVRTCPYYIPDAPAETPPYRIDEIDNGLYWMVPGVTGGDWPVCNVHGIHDLCYREKCKDVCLRRQGLGLLRTCQQINAEASPIFWKHLTVCFNEVDTLVPILRSLPDDVRNRIRKVSFMSPRRILGSMVDHTNDPIWWSRFWERHTRVAMPDVFHGMDNLEDLELPAEYFDVLQDIYIRFQRLKHLRVVTTGTACYRSDNYHIFVDLGLTKRFDPLGMGLHLCSPVGIYCQHCHDFFNRIAEEGSALTNLRADSGDFWVAPAREVLARRRPNRADHSPYKFSITLRGGAKFQVKAWGLPANDHDTREKVWRAEFLAEINRIPRKHPAVKVNPDVDGVVEKQLVSKEDLDSRRHQRYTGPYKNSDTLTKRRRSEGKRRDLDHAAARRDKYESGGYEVAEEKHEVS